MATNGMILAGDVGGTKTLLEIGRLQDGRWQPAFGARYFAADYPDLNAVLEKFFEEWTAQREPRVTLTDACLGVAGPVFDNRAQLTNLPWIIVGSAIAAQFGIPRVVLVNDFAAAATGVDMLQEDDLACLQAGEALTGAPRLVIGAGTGLGVAYLIWTRTGYQVVAGETGHAGFAPATPEQAELWNDLHQRLGRVTNEDVVSGPGLVRVYEHVQRKAAPMSARSDTTPAAIVRSAIDLGDPVSTRALDLFIACYGEVAANCALAVLARGGVYVAGGIAPRILPRLRTGGFLTAFNAKGSYSATARKMPLAVVTNERLGLLGSALIASRR